MIPLVDLDVITIINLTKEVHRHCFLLEIVTAKAEDTTRTGLHQIHIHLKSPLTWQHDIKLLPHRKQIDNSTVR